MNRAAVRAKANAHYQCQECGSLELIQAHHELPGDDNTLIALCADCHSKRHPDIPKALFFNKNNQPYWQNKSAASLAKDWGICSRTLIRAARRLGILQGELIGSDETLIRNNIPKLQWGPEDKSPKNCHSHMGKLSTTIKNFVWENSKLVAVVLDIKTDDESILQWYGLSKEKAA